MSDAWSERLWSAFWYFVLPAVLAVCTVLGLTAAHVIDEAVPWEFLLAFAAFEMLLVGVRDRLLGSRHHGRMDLRTVVNEGRELQRERERLQKKANLPEEARRELDLQSAALDEAITRRKADAVAHEVRALDALIEKHLGAVRKGTAREYVEAIGFAVLVALGIRALVVEAFKIPSPSMYPTLNVGDNIFVNKFVYGPLVPFTRHRLFNGQAVKRGDVIVFVYPLDPSKDYIKRVMGLEGDRVRVFDDGNVEVNGELVSRCEIGEWTGDDGDGRIAGTTGASQRLFLDWHGEQSFLTLQLREDPDRIERHRDAHYAVESTYTVPPGNVFVMGDNRDNSSDSRYWGTVPMANIKGRAMRIWWSNLPGAGFGMRWDRFGQSIMGTPVVPPALRAGYDACVRQGREHSRPVRPAEAH